MNELMQYFKKFNYFFEFLPVPEADGSDAG